MGFWGELPSHVGEALRDLHTHHKEESRVASDRANKGGEEKWRPYVPKMDRSVKDMLTKPAAGKVKADNPVTGKLREEETEEDNGAPVTRSFLEGLFTSLRDDIQRVKRDLSPDLKVVRRELEEVSKRMATLEEHENARGEEIEQLQQEIIRLQDQQIELQ
ncbi:hypothetical protein NDU88_012577 [Pleurodeles waltl]|uniref:Uncharacterized protein n=1 Tax=Pleurodeles waltl TaxID=8319 RepID=A0AAV7R511_PLEWA|nr:hypothetical protein NDU88_012577 [Pleurodeles waltl]